MTEGIGKLVLIALAVLAGIIAVFFVWTYQTPENKITAPTNEKNSLQNLMDALRSMISSQSTQAQTQVRIDMVTFFPKATGNNTVTLTIRNTGSVLATIESVSIKNNTGGASYVTCSLPTPKPTIDAGSAIDINVGWGASATITASTVYVLRVTTTTGFYYELVASS